MGVLGCSHDDLVLAAATSATAAAAEQCVLQVHRGQDSEAVHVQGKILVGGGKGSLSMAFDGRRAARRSSSHRRLLSRLHQTLFSGTNHENGRELAAADGVKDWLAV